MIKEKLRCIYWNYIKKEANFKISFKKNFWEVKLLNGLKFKFLQNPYPYFLDVKHYFRHYRLKKGDNIIDAGAYPGDFAMYCAKKVYPGKVVAFEPDEKNYSRTKRNIELNKIDNIILIQKAIFSKEGQINFDNENKEDSKISPTGKDKIYAVVLDKELKRIGIQKIDFLKIDIEGAELEAIKGINQILKENPSYELAVASYHIVNGEKTRYRLEEAFKKMGLKSFTLGPPHTTTFAFKDDYLFL